MTSIKKLFTSIFLLLFLHSLEAQVGINTLNPDNSAELDISSNKKGLLIPRLDTLDVYIPTATGLMVFQESDNKFYYFDGSKWQLLGPAEEVSPFDKIIDADGNTAVMVEKTANDDIIRFEIDGKPMLSIKDNGFGTTIFELQDINENVSIGGVGNLIENTTGYQNVAIGVRALRFNENGDRNIAVGNNALFANISGGNNIALGLNSMLNNTIGYSNIGLGQDALIANVNGHYNIALGQNSLNENVNGTSNVAIGLNSMHDNTTGYDNVGIGYQSMHDNSSGDLNIGISKEALKTNITGNQNVAVGYRALYSHGYGDHNTALGTQALFYHEEGNGNVALGHNAFRNNKFGVKNVGLGYKAGHGELGSNKLYIENSEADSTAALIFGDFENDYLRFNAATKINGADANDYALDVWHLNYGLRLFQQNPYENPSYAYWELYVSAEDQDLELYKSNFVRGNFNASTGAYSHISDRRLKEEIKPLEHVLDKIIQLDPVRYHFIHDENKNNQIGFIAQDVEKLFPEFISAPNPNSKRDDTYKMNYSGLSVIAIAAIQEQQTIIEAQEKINFSQQEKIAEQEERIKKLELALQSILEKM